MVDVGKCIDAVGMKAHGTSIDARLDKAKQAVRFAMVRANVLRQVFRAVGEYGRVSVIGVYAGFIDNFPYGEIAGKSVTFRNGQCDTQKYNARLLKTIENARFDGPRSSRTI